MRNRRSFLLGAAGACLGPCCAGSALAATGLGAIDTHHHYMSPGYAATKREAYLAAAGFPFAMEWTAQQSLEGMDQAGVAKSYLSLSAPGVWFGDVEEGRRLAREANEYGARLAADAKGRFGLFASLPLPDTDGSLAEIDYALDRLGADGFVLMTNYDDRYLGHRAFAPVLAELNRRGAVVFVHPTRNNCWGAEPLETGLNMGVLELPFDSTRTIASLVVSGRLAETRRIRWIFSHAGGGLVGISHRLAIVAGGRRDSARVAAAEGGVARLYPDGIVAELGRLYYDTASVAAPAPLSGLRTLVPDTQILFGSDTPYGNLTQIADLQRLSLPEATLGLILRGNAERIFART